MIITISQTSTTCLYGYVLCEYHNPVFLFNPHLVVYKCPHSSIDLYIRALWDICPLHVVSRRAIDRTSKEWDLFRDKEVVLSLGRIQDYGQNICRELEGLLWIV